MHGPCEEASQYALRDIIRQLLVGCQEDDNSEWVAEESSVWDKTQHKTLAAMLTEEKMTHWEAKETTMNGISMGHEEIILLETLHVCLPKSLLEL